MQQHARPMSHRPSVPSKQRERRLLSREQKVLIRELTDAMLYAARDVKGETDKRWVFDNASAGRFSPVTDFACAVDQLLRTTASTDDIADIFDRGKALVLARRAMPVAPPLVEALKAQTRAEAIENPLQDEVLTDPTCSTKRRRLIVVMSNTVTKTVTALAALVNAEQRDAEHTAARQRFGLAGKGRAS